MTLLWLWAFAVFPLQNILAQNAASNSSLALGPITFAGFNNYVYRDEVTSAVAVISGGTSITSSGTPSRPGSSGNRFIIAFPKGNSGIGTYLLPLNGTLSTTFDNSSFTSITAPNNQVGVTTSLNVSTDVQLGKTLIGSVRTIRDYVEGNGTENAIFNYTLGTYNATSFTLIRRWINGTTVQYLNFVAAANFNFTVTPNQNATLPPDIRMIRPDQARNGTLTISTTFNFTGPGSNSTNLTGLGRSQLFLTTAPNSSQTLLQSTLTAINGPGASIANQTAFLAYSTEFLAGSWRFLTYFGRDTLLTLRLLMPTMSSTASEAILRAVIERTRDITVPGELCHEETVGDYASFVNLQNNQSYLGNYPSYSYVMVDTDFLLLPVLSEYLLTTPQGQGRAGAFLNSTSGLNTGTLLSLLRLNVDHVMNLSRPFAANQTATNLVRIRDANVGNWRDSNAGLGGGKFPFDVNCAFVPAALRAIADLSNAGILPSNHSSEAMRSALIWETAAPPLFEVAISNATAASRVSAYITAANLTNATISGAGVMNGSSASAGYSDTSQFIGSGAPFYALSLLENGTTVKILNSDLCFLLEYNTNVSESVIRATIQALQPYPRGLLTNVGMVVANAAYSPNTSDAAVFANSAYHGAVSWSWQSGLMAKGIAKQLALAGVSSPNLDALPANATKPAWANNATLVSQLQQAQTRLWDSIAGSRSVLYTEVWSPVYDASRNTFTIGDLGTEGDAIQLWSYGFLGLVDPRTNQPVAAGF